MAAVTSRAGRRIGPQGWLTVLLAAALFINYVDRGNLATAAPLLKGELKLSNAQMGLLASAFFWVYAPATLAGPCAAGRWIGVQNFLGNLAGIVAPWLTGVLVDRTGDFRIAFLTAAAVLTTGLLGWGVMLRRIEPVAWREAC